MEQLVRSFTLVGISELGRERVELNLHAPRCGVARACRDFQISACVWRAMQDSFWAGQDISSTLTLTLTGA
jgi:hypothetical protein